MQVVQKGANRLALADVYSDDGALIEGQFFFNGVSLNAASGTVGVSDFASLESDKVRGASAGDEFAVEITKPSLGMPGCSVTVSVGTATCE